MIFDKIKNKIPKGKDSRALISNFGYLTLLQVAGYIFPILTIPYLSRVIGVEGFGKIGFASAVMVWIQTVADWGFLLTATRDVAKCRDNKEEVSRIFSETFWARCILMVFSFIILLLMILLIPEFRNNTTILLLTFLMIPGHIMFPDWFFQAIERMKYTTITNLIVKVIFTLAVFIFIKEKDDYILQPLLTSVGYIIAGAIAMYIILWKWKYRLHFVPFKDVFRAIKGSTDVFINTLFPNLYNSLSVVLLGFFGGPVANGIYSAGEKFVSIAHTFLNIISRVFFPFLSRRIDKHHLFVSLFVGVSSLVSVVLFFAAPLIIDWFYTEEFFEAITVLRILAVSLIFLAVSNAYGTNYLIVQGHERILRRITMWCSIAGFFVAFPLIYYYSYIGVAITVTFTRFMLGACCWAAVMRIRKQKLTINSKNKDL